MIAVLNVDGEFVAIRNLATNRPRFIGPETVNATRSSVGDLARAVSFSSQARTVWLPARVRRAANWPDTTGWEMLVVVTNITPRAHARNRASSSCPVERAVVTLSYHIITNLAECVTNWVRYSCPISFIRISVVHTHTSRNNIKTFNCNNC